MRCSHRAKQSLALPRSPLRGGSGLLARGGVPPAPPCAVVPGPRPPNTRGRGPALYRWGRTPLRSVRPPGRSIPSAFESVSVVPTAASGAGSPEACRARPAAFRNPVQRAASGPAVAWLAGGPRGREVASPCGPRLRRAWAPAPQYAAWGAQTLQGMRKKSALRGSACRPAPGGRASRCPPWRVLRPRSYPPPSPPASVAGGCRGRFWLPSPGGGARSTRLQGAGGVRPLPAGCSLGLSPRSVFSLPPPAISLAGQLFPLRLG